MKTAHSLKDLITHASLMLLAALLVTSCIKDDLTDCPPPYNVRLQIMTDADANGLPISPTFDQYNIDSVAVFVFDAQGNFVAHWDGGAYTSGQAYVVPLDLAPGSYQIYSFTNQCGSSNMNVTDDEIISRSLSLDDIAMIMERSADQPITDDVLDLHLGQIANVVIPEEDTPGTVYDYTVVVKPQNYKVNFKLIGLPEGDEAVIEVNDRNFARSLGDVISLLPGSMTYERLADLTKPTTFTEREASMTMYNLATDKEMELRIVNTATGEVRYVNDLIDMIEKAYARAGRTLDFSTMFEFDVVLSFGANLDVTVTIDGWKYTDDDVNIS